MTTVAIISSRLTLDSRQYDEGIAQAQKQASSFQKHIEGVGKTLRNVGGILTGAFTVPLVAMGVKSAMSAGRVDELDLVVRTLGKTAGYTETEIDGYVQSVRKMGIEHGASREIIAKFVTAQLNAADASKIARIAQDQAVITGENSTETTMRLTDAIIKGSQETFRAMMMNINLSDAYEKLAAEMGIHVDELSEVERVQARVNAVVEYGATVTGTYEASMESGTKQLRSFKRYIDDIFVAVGQHLTPALNDIVFTGKEVLKWIEDLVSDGGALEPVLKGWGSAIEGAVFHLKGMLSILQDLPDWMLQFIANTGLILAVLGPLLLVGGQVAVMLPTISTGLAALGVTSLAALGPLALVGVAIVGLVTIIQNHKQKVSELADAYADVREEALKSDKDFQAYKKSLEGANEATGNAGKGLKQHQASLKDNKAELDRLRDSLVITEEDYNSLYFALQNGQATYQGEIILLEEVGEEIYNLALEHKNLVKGMAASDEHMIKVAGSTVELADALEEASEASIKMAQELAKVLSLEGNMGGIAKLAQDYDKIWGEIAEKKAEVNELMAIMETGGYIDGLYVSASEAKAEIGLLTGEISTLESEMSSLADQVVLDMFAATIAIGGVTEAEFEAYMALGVELGKWSQAAADAAILTYGGAIDAINGMVLEDKSATYTINFQYNDMDRYGHGLEQRAAGGPVSSGSPYIVGERGPELFVPNTSGQIIPNDKLGDSGGDVYVYATVDNEIDIYQLAHRVAEEIRRNE